MLTVWLPHDIHIVHTQMMHGLESRSNYLQHGPYVTYINRIAIQQRLLVKFSCDLYIDSLLRALLVCMIIGLCVQWLPQHILYLETPSSSLVITQSKIVFLLLYLSLSLNILLVDIKKFHPEVELIDKVLTTGYPTCCMDTY